MNLKENMNTLCVISHSGGLDSTTLMAKALAQGKLVLPVNFNYGQKNEIELMAHKNVIKHYKERYHKQMLPEIGLDFNLLFSDIINSFKTLRDNGKIKDNTSLEYYMPFRNLVFSSIAAMIGEMTSLRSDLNITELEIGIGVHKHSSETYVKDYWDITPDFVNQLESVMSLNDSINVSVFAPYKDDFKSKIIEDVRDLMVPYHLTWTCYNPNEVKFQDKFEYTPCLGCESCIEREMQAVKVGIDDINDYRIVHNIGLIGRN